jgi:hypothetical protein
VTVTVELNTGVVEQVALWYRLNVIDPVGVGPAGLAGANVAVSLIGAPTSPVVVAAAVIPGCALVTVVKL